MPEAEENFNSRENLKMNRRSGSAITWRPYFFESGEIKRESRGRKNERTASIQCIYPLELMLGRVFSLSSCHIFGRAQGPIHVVFKTFLYIGLNPLMAP